MPSDNDNDRGAGASDAIEAFYDGACPVCCQEVDWLRRRDGLRRIHFVDIAAPDFDPDRDAGMPIARREDCFQARLPNGEVLEGAEAFRQLYEIMGTERSDGRKRLSVLSPVLELGYRWVVKQRLRRAGERIGRACTCGRKVD